MMNTNDYAKKIESKIEEQKMIPVFADGLVIAVRLTGNPNEMDSKDTNIELVFIDNRYMQPVARIVIPKLAIEGFSKSLAETLQKLNSGKMMQ
jgi:hypothetical protein